jgi:predicted O-methyltransferase YrrM
MYDFVSNVMDTTKEYYNFDAIENQRLKLVSSKDLIEVDDFGAGSTKLKGKWRKVADIVKVSLSGVKKCRLLFNLVNHYNCQNILELGTSLGISTAYLAAADRKAQVISLEGSKNIVDIAADVNKNLGFTQVEILPGPFTVTLPVALKMMDKIDFAFIDGHHASGPALSYFESIIKKCHDDSIIVLDDIHWSEDMTSLWEMIKKRPDITLTVDLYDFGIVFFKPTLSKQDIRYISFEYKPWQIGLFG